MHHLRPLIIPLLTLVLLSGCSGGRTAYQKAEKLEREGNLDQALVKYAEVAAAHPEIGEYRVGYLRASEGAARVHVKKGDAAFAAKNLDVALREYQTAYAMDPSLAIAKQQADLVLRLSNARIYYQQGVDFEKDHKPREAVEAYRKSLELESGNGQTKEALERLLKTKHSKLDGYDLNLKSHKLITLKFKDAKLKEIFTILTQLSGINFIFDEGVKDVNVTLMLENATFQQALDVITGMNKLGRKILNESTVLLYTKTPDKTKQYEDLFVQTFYLNKLDAKKAVNLVRTMLQVKKIYVNEEMNALVIRDTPEVVEVARKILEANDVPDAEVILDVEVIELSKQNADTFGIALSRYAISSGIQGPQGGSFLADTLSSTTTTNTGQTSVTTNSGPGNLLHLFNYRNYNGFITVPNATFNFGKTLANGETLSNPKIRVKNREKAKFNVGTRVPITTTSSPSGGGVSVNVQYVDVGVKVNAEPVIQLNNEVVIKLGLEVSSILQKDTIGTDQATTVVTIGTRNLDTVLSLKDGETSIIGGLIQKQKSDSKSKVFLLGDIPFLGALFTNTNDSANKTELMLAITPRIVRGITVPEGEVSAFWSGREDDPSTALPYASFAQEPDFSPLTTAPATPAAPGALPSTTKPRPTVLPSGVIPPAPAATAPAVPAPPAATTSTAAPIPSPAGNQAPPTPASPVPAPGASVAPAQSSAAAPAAKSGAAASAKEVAKGVDITVDLPKTVKINEEFLVRVSQSGAKELKSAAFALRYDPKILQLLGQTEGTFLKQGGAKTTFQAFPDRNKGELWLSLSREEAAVGATGTGTLASVTFKALAPGSVELNVVNPYLTSRTGAKLDAVPISSTVEVK